MCFDGAMGDFISRTIGNMAGVWLASLWVGGVTFVASGEVWQTLLNLFVIAIILAIVNSVIRPVVKVLALPLYIITLGLFAFVTNGLMFWLAGWLAGQFSLPLHVDGFWPAVWGGLVTAIVAGIISAGLNAILPGKQTRYDIR